MDVFVPKYWPFFATAERRVFRYRQEGDPKVQFSSVFSFDAASNSMLCVDANADGVWTDTWWLQYRPGFGLAEWRDTYPKGKVETYTTPIGWGEVQTIGTVYRNKPRVNVFRTWPPTLPLTGSQQVSFEALLDEFTLRDGTVYRDVLQMFYQQTWGRTSGGRYWMAAGVGPVAVQWAAPNAAGTGLDVTDRYDAEVTSA